MNTTVTGTQRDVGAALRSATGGGGPADIVMLAIGCKRLPLPSSTRADQAQEEEPPGNAETAIEEVNVPVAEYTCEGF